MEPNVYVVKLETETEVYRDTQTDRYREEEPCSQYFKFRMRMGRIGVKLN